MRTLLVSLEQSKEVNLAIEELGKNLQAAYCITELSDTACLRAICLLGKRVYERQGKEFKSVLSPDKIAETISRKKQVAVNNLSDCDLSAYSTREAKVHDLTSASDFLRILLALGAHEVFNG